MRFRLTFLSIAVSLLFSFPLLSQSGEEYNPGRVIDSIYIPGGSATSIGNGVFVGPLGNTARTYQLLIHESELTTLIGKELKAISMRIPAASTTAWPDAELTYSSYDIYLSGSVAPVDRSLTFALNVVGTQTQVRSGSLVIPPQSYPFGGSPNYCGPEITFNTPWLYNGGHLLIEIRQNASNGTSRSVDAFTTSSSGYGSLYSAAWTGSYTGVTGTAGNFAVTKITYDDPVPVELVSFTGQANNNNVELIWSTATETNNSGFQIEKFTGENWSSIGFVEGFGTTSETRHYNFIERNVVQGEYKYRLKQIDFNGSFEYSRVIEVIVGLPGTFTLEQNYPNPFNPSTTILYSVPQTSFVSIKLFDVLGNEIQTIVNEEKAAGKYEITINAANLPSGVYYYQMTGNKFSDTKRMLLVK